MKQYINRRHISLVLALFVLYLAITYWEIVAKFIQTIFSATVPLLIGTILAYIVNLLLKQYEHLYLSLFKKPSAQKFKRPVGIVMSYLTIILIIAVVFALVIPELITCVKLLIANHSHIINHFIDYFEHTVILKASSITLMLVKFNGINLVNILRLALVELSGRLFQQPHLYFRLPQLQLLRFSSQSTS